ncbi:MAG: ABC transporter permease [Erysipelotrichaceae bacterium]
MKRFLRKYGAFAKGSFEVAIMYRVHILLWVFGDFFSLGLTILLWVAIYANSPTDMIRGFTLIQMIFYNLVIHLTGSITYMSPLSDVAEDYYDGRISMSLIKPASYAIQLFFRNLGNNLFSNLFITLPTFLLIATVSLATHQTESLAWLSFPIFLFSSLLGLFINYFANFIFSNLVFYTDATFGMFQLNQAIVRIFSGALIPLNFFPGWLRSLAGFLPYAGVQYIPAMILLGRTTGNDLLSAIGVQVLWVVFLGFAAQLVWSHSLSRMKVMGG